jgi:hypothetical protein
MTELEAHGRLGRPKRSDIQQGMRDIARMMDDDARRQADLDRTIVRIGLEAGREREREAGLWRPLVTL